MGALYIKTRCNGCMHERVCNRKSDFETLCELIEDIHHPSDERINIKDYYDAKVEISCPHFRVNYVTSTKLYEGSLKKSD